jgi:hypothetical protein
VATWGCHIEDLLSKAGGQFGPAESEQMLRTVFWSGLSQQLKDVSGHLFDRVKDFDHLRILIRWLEQDRKPKKDEPKKMMKSATVDPGMAEMKNIVRQLSSEVKSLKDMCHQRQPVGPSHHAHQQQSDGFCQHAGFQQGFHQPSASFSSRPTNFHRQSSDVRQQPGYDRLPSNSARQPVEDHMFQEEGRMSYVGVVDNRDI